MSLGTFDENGPWVADVIYVFDDDLNLYWLSDTSTRHSKALLKNPKVATTITLSNKQGEDNIGLQLEGIAQKVEGEIFELAVKHRLKRKKKPPTRGEKFLDEGESWYLLKPSKIELIYEPKWGFNKKILEL